jgi:multidrug efflux pump subunit AcrB
MHSMIRWFARNHVASNLLMWMLLLLGAFLAWKKIPIEYFPENEPDEVRVSMSYRGATPAEVEEGVVIKIENAIRDLPGIREMRSYSSEGNGEVEIEVEKGRDPRQLLDDIKNRVDSINTFTGDMERPVVALNQRVMSAVTVIVSADMSAQDLRSLGEQVRDQLTMMPGVTLANLRGVRPYEIAIEVSEESLRRYGMSLADVSAAIRRNSIDIPAGGVKTAAGDVLLRTKGQAYRRADFEKLILRAEPNGARVTLSDVARVRDDFDEDPLYCIFNGKPSVFVRVERTGDQNLLTVTDSVKEWLKTAHERLPAGVEVTLWRDNSRPVRERLSYLLWNGLQGGALVFLALALFLRISFAFWVVLGIPIAFAGGLIVMHYLGFTINMFSLFGFIVVMGIITDDAIVVGESVYSHARSGKNPEDAAIEGTLDVATPVTFGVLTVVVAFLPLLVMTGRWGSFFEQIPVVVVPVLLASLVESKLILPAHLAKVRWDRKPGRLGQIQQNIADWLDTFVVQKLYLPVLRVTMEHRYATLAVFLGILAVSFGTLKGGHLKWVPFPRFQSDSVSGQLEMSLGTPAHITEAHMRHMIETAGVIQKKYLNASTGKSEVMNVMAVMGSMGVSMARVSNSGSSHLCEVVLELPPPEERTIDTEALKAEWRKLIGEIPGARELRFQDSWGSGRAPLDIQISGQDLAEMLAVSEKLQDHVKTYEGINDVYDDYATGKEEIQIVNIKPEAEARGVTREMVARQLRQAFFGDEAQRIQRGRDDVRVMVRYPKAERTSLDNLEKMMIRAPDGSEIPFSSAAEYRFGRSPTSIRRFNRARVIHVLADIDQKAADILAVRAALETHITELRREHPSLAISIEGEAREERESFETLLWGLVFVLFSLYALMAIPFGSYWLPLIILLVIPFGWIGAALGHLLKGISISFFSVLGMLTLSGVVVNDSLVLVDYVNKCRDEGMSVGDAARAAGAARFRAIFLTNLTTFAGLMPVIFQGTLSENFLNQMSISIAFGVMFSFTVTLFLVPINYLVLDDISRLLGKLRGRRPEPVTPAPGDAAGANP